jgi:hypothetical protein
VLRLNPGDAVARQNLGLVDQARRRRGGAN